MKKSTLFTLAVAGLVAAGMAVKAVPASANDHHGKKHEKKEKHEKHEEKTEKTEEKHAE